MIMRIRALGAAIAVLALVSAGCGTGSGSEPDPAPSSSAPVESSAPPTPEPLSKDAYQKLLTGSESTLRKAFDKAMAAKSLKELQSSAKQLAGTLADQAETFEDTLAPDAALSVNDQVATLLAAANPAVSTGESKANECGIKPTETERLIKAKQDVHESVPADDVKQLTGKFKNAGYSWGTKLLPAKPETPPVKKRRAENGEIIERNGSRGYNLLQIKNDTSGDVVIAAVTKNPKEPMASIYVRAGKSTTLEGLAAKKYTVYYKSGTDWDDDKLTFTRNCSFEKFRQSFTPESNWSIELQKRIGGNAPTDPSEPF